MADSQPRDRTSPPGRRSPSRAGDLPAIRAHFDHAARQVKIDVFEATKLKLWGRATTEDYYSQNSAATGAAATYTFGWNGTTVLNKTITKVPNGKYVIKLSVLKALGDAEQPGRLGGLDLADDHPQSPVSA